MTLNIDTGLLKEFEKGLNTLHPEKSLIPVKILGYGEISIVFQLDVSGQEDIAYKRMPIFDREEQVRHYLDIYDEYSSLLLSMGVALPEYDSASIKTDKGSIVLFGAQRKLPSASIGNQVIHRIADADITRFVMAVFMQLKKIWDFNKSSSAVKLGIDGQISNWAIKDFDSETNKLPDNLELIYIDTGTPLFRKDQVEMLDAELFLKSTPSFLRWLVRWTFLQGVIDRYYDFRLVIIDLIANFNKEGRADVISGLISTANTFFSTSASSFDIKPVTYKEVESYYRQDAFIWRLFLALRKLDRFLSTKILMGNYEFILPKKINR